MGRNSNKPDCLVNKAEPVAEKGSLKSSWGMNNRLKVRRQSGITNPRGSQLRAVSAGAPAAGRSVSLWKCQAGERK